MIYRFCLFIMHQDGDRSQMKRERTKKEGNHGQFHLNHQFLFFFYFYFPFIYEQFIIPRHSCKTSHLLKTSFTFAQININRQIRLPILSMNRNRFMNQFIYKQDVTEVIYEFRTTSLCGIMQLLCYNRRFCCLASVFTHV